MTALTVFNRDFEGTPLTTINYKGKPAWIARQIGVALGYSHGGKRLPNKILGEWGDEFQQGADYAILVGDDLQEFKAATGADGDQVPARTNRGLLVLFESGLYLVLAKTHHAAGKRLRRFLADEVLPQIARDGSFRPGRKVVDDRLVEPPPAPEAEAPRARPPEPPVAGDDDDAQPGDDSQPDDGSRPPRIVFALVAPPAPPPLRDDPATRREDRLGYQAGIHARSLDLSDRRFRVNALYRLIAVLRDRLNQETRASLEISACEIATGADLTPLKPGPNAGWMTVPDIASLLGATVQRVGRAVTILGLRRTAAGMAHQGLRKAEGEDRLFVTWFYSPEAVERISRSLGA